MSFILVHVVNKTYLQNEGLWKVFEAIEISVSILAFIAIILVIFSIYVLTVTNLLHKNFLSLVYVFGLQYIFSAGAQAVIFYMQLKSDDTITLYSNDLFIVMAWIRGFCIFLATYTALVMALERILSTIFIKDYEAKNRVFIPILLIALQAFCSLVSILLYYEAKVGEIYLLSFVITVDLVSFIFYLLCVYIDIKRYQQYIYPVEIASYQKSRHMTLSERFQLAENLRTANLFKYVSILVTFFNILLLSVGLIKPLDLGLFTTHLIYAAFDLADVAYAITLPIIILTCNEIWRSKTLEILSKIPFIKYFHSKNNVKTMKLKTSRGRKMIFSAESQQDYHFDVLKKSWN